MMTQAAFSRFIGVSRKTVTTMKSNGELVMNITSVDSIKSIDKLKSLGRSFSDDGKLIKKEAEESSISQDSVTLLSEKMIPEKNLSNMSTEESEERKKLLQEAETLKREAENEYESDVVDHDTKIGELTLSEARLIKEYWLGVSLKRKAEQEAGKLVYEESVDDALYLLGRQVREKIDSLPRIAFKLVGKNIQEIESILEDEKDAVLKILGDIHVSW